MPVGFKHSWLSTKSPFAREASSAMATQREAAANLVLSTVLPHSVRMGTRVLETLGNMRKLSYDSIGCKQALPIFEELVKAGQEPVGEDFRRRTWSIALQSGWSAAQPPRTLRP